MYHISALFWKWFVVTLFRRKKVKGRENLPLKGPYMIVANHVSIYDPWDIVAAYGCFREPICWMAAIFLFSKERAGAVFFGHLPPFLQKVFGGCISFIVYSSKTIPVERDIDGRGESSSVNLQSYRNMKEVFKAGGVVGIFPEGSVNSKRGMYSGFIRIAARHHVPIVRVKITPQEIEFFSPISLDASIKGKKNISDIAEKVFVC